MSLVSAVTQFLSVLTVATHVLIVVLLLSMFIKKKPFIQIRAFFAKRKGLFAAIVASTAFVGSMFYSQVAKYTPCLLCWYQRIAIFPQFALLWFAYVRKEVETIKWYMLPLLLVGLAISGYHWMIQLFPPDNPGPCGLEASCVARYIYEMNHITIATMAFTACLLVLILLFIDKGVQKKRVTR